MHRIPRLVPRKSGSVGADAVKLVNGMFDDLILRTNAFVQWTHVLESVGSVRALAEVSMRLSQTTATKAADAFVDVDSCT
jgi:hypothetical protein